MLRRFSNGAIRHRAQGTFAATARQTLRPAASAPPPPKTMLVLYGSATGSAEALARMVGTAGATHGYKTQVLTLDAGAMGPLQGSYGATPDVTLIITSTYGSGEFPSNAKRFQQALSAGKLDAALQKTKVALFGLGNEHNADYCAAAKIVEQRLRVAKATTLMPTKLSSDHAVGGHEPAFRQWKRDLWASLGCSVEGGAATIATSYTVAPAPHGTEKVPVPAGFASCVVADTTLHSPSRYIPLHKTVRFVVPSGLQLPALGGRNACYRDQLQVFPENPSRAVAKMLVLLKGLGDPDAPMTVKADPGVASSAVDNATLTLRQLLTHVLDLQCPPTRAVLEAFAAAAQDPKQRATLDELANNFGADSPFDKKFGSECWTTVDALAENPSVQLTIPQMLTHWPRLQPRTYSISADPALTGAADTLAITFDVPHRFHTDGLCSGYLSRLPAGGKALVRVLPGTLPDVPLEQDVVLLALGTGIAPIHALLEHRAAAKRAGTPIGAARLYYGCRHTGKSQLFVDDVKKWLADGVLVSASVVGSHDTDEFRTPLSLIAEDKSHRAAVAAALKPQTGHFVYCGVGGAVPSLVENSLRRAGVDVGVLRLEGRYHEEFFNQDADFENLFKDHVASLVGDQATLAARYSGSDMFCFQCEQTFGNKGCFRVGVCGKTPRVAALQDLTTHQCKVLSFYLHQLRTLGVADDAVSNRFTLYAMFSTLTNVNNDEARFVEILGKLQGLTARAKAAYEATCLESLKTASSLGCITLPTETGAAVPPLETLLKMGRLASVLSQFTEPAHQSAAGVAEMLSYAVKGICAYADHSLVNAKEDPAIYAFVHKALAHLVSEARWDLGATLGLLMEAGKINVATMALLDQSHSSTLGDQSPHAVKVKPVPGKAILFSGHDLIMLEALLKKCDAAGNVFVYTHGETLPAHAYPTLRKHKSLAGHYGGAWMRQAVEFPHFPGPVVMSTNCITEPQLSYRESIFTCGAVGWPGVTHIGDEIGSLNWDAVIAKAQAMKGFTEVDTEFAYADPVGMPRPAQLTVGFGHKTILGAAPTILEQVQKGNITRFFVIGGCDGFEGQRSYYTDLVKQLPKTAVILTVGCGKFRFNHLEAELGTIGDTGIPRILDMGQCSDSFGAVQVALGLAGALKCEVKDLPLSIVLSWFEQKAIAVLLSLMALGIKPIRVGPSLPAFVTPEVLGVLVKDYGIKVCGDPVQDAKDMCAAKTMLE